MSTMIVKSETKPYIEAFRARPRSDEPRWLAAKREAALANFGEKGFPTRRQEAWRFTNLRPLERAALLPADSAAAEPAFDGYRLASAAHRLVFVNGRFAPSLSDIGALPKGAWLASSERTLAERPDALAAAIEETDTAGAQPFASLNAALFADGVVLILARHGRDVREVLRGGAQHRRPADVDHLDDIRLGDSAPPRHRRERIEVDAHDL